MIFNIFALSFFLLEIWNISTKMRLYTNWDELSNSQITLNVIFSVLKLFYYPWILFGLFTKLWALFLILLLTDLIFSLLFWNKNKNIITYSFILYTITKLSVLLLLIFLF